MRGVKYRSWQHTEALNIHIKPKHIEAVQPFFQIDESTIISPELNDYRQHLEERREKQRRGGRKGANKTNSKAKSSDKTESSGNPRVSRRGSGGSLVMDFPGFARHQIALESNSRRGVYERQTIYRRV